VPVVHGSIPHHISPHFENRRDGYLVLIVKMRIIELKSEVMSRES